MIKGAVLATVGIVLVAYLLAGRHFDNPGVALAATVALLVVAILSAFRVVRPIARGFLAATALWLSLSVALSLVTAGTAKEEAEKLVAVGQRACFQVPDGSGDYRPARSWLDLTAFGMSADRSPRIALQYHGILAIERASGIAYHDWSYRAGTWLPLKPDARAFPVLRCVPDVVAREGASPGAPKPEIPMSDVTGGIDFAVVNGKAFGIPKDYRASFTSGDGHGGALFVHAVGPDFSPGGPAAVDPPSVEFRDRDWIENLARGFARRRPLDPDLGRSASDGTFVDRDRDGHIDTVISCTVTSIDGKDACQHWFYRDGATWSFRQDAATLPQWRDLERRFVARVSGFEARGKDVLSNSRR